MKLYGSLMSPYARKVRILLGEKGMACAFEVMNVMDPDCPVVQHNPLGKLPALLLDNGTALYDSRVIVEFLDAISTGDRLIPTDPYERSQVRKLEALADGVVDAGSLLRSETQRGAALWNEAARLRQTGKIERGIESIAQIVAEQSWSCLSRLTLADIAIGCALGWISFRFPDLNWRANHAALAQYFDRLSMRPAFAGTTPADNPALALRQTILLPLIADVSI
jgi:glutathione S-transferase